MLLPGLLVDASGMYVQLNHSRLHHRENWDYSTEGDLSAGTGLSPRPKPRPARRKDWEKVCKAVCI